MRSLAAASWLCWLDIANAFGLQIVVMATIMFHYGVSDANAACNPRHGAPYYLTYLIPYYHTIDKVFAMSRRWNRHCAFWGMRRAHFSTALSVACGQRACSCSWSRQTTVDYQLRLEYRVFFSLMTLTYGVLVFRPRHQLVSSVYTTYLTLPASTEHSIIPGLLLRWKPGTCG